MFDLEKFKAGVPALDRKGREWTFVNVHKGSRRYPLLAKSPARGVESFTLSGRFTDCGPEDADLVTMADATPQLTMTEEPAPVQYTDVFEEAYQVGRLIRLRGLSREHKVVLLAPKQAVLEDTDGYLRVRLREFAAKWELVPATEEVTCYLNVYDGKVLAHLTEDRARDAAGSEPRAVAVPVTFTIPRR